MMAGQHHAQPGTYRTVNVRIGRYIPPFHDEVPHLMDELFNWLSSDRHRERCPFGSQSPAAARWGLLSRTDTPEIPRAVWAHIQFETIHPFADGNGRTGRAIMQAAMRTTLPLSPFILRERPRYYELFGEASWPAWLQWFCRGIVEECAK